MVSTGRTFNNSTVPRLQGRDPESREPISAIAYPNKFVRDLVNRHFEEFGSEPEPPLILLDPRTRLVLRPRNENVVNVLRSLPQLYPNLRTLNLEYFGHVRGEVRSAFLELMRNGEFPAGLTFLELNDNGVLDASELNLPATLTRLLLNNNSRLANLGQLSLPATLTHLELSGNDIVDVSQLSLPAALIHLDLSSNKIVDLSELTLNSALRHLVLRHNRIVEVSPLNLLVTALTHLDFYSIIES